MDKIAMYREAILNEAFNKIAKEERPNMFNAQYLVNKESSKEFGTKERLKHAGKVMAGAMAGGVAGGALGKSVGRKVSVRIAAKKPIESALMAEALTAAGGMTAGQLGGAVLAGKKGKEKARQAEMNAASRLADKYYGDNNKIKAIVNKKPNKFVGSYANNLLKAEKAYKKELKNR